MSWGGTRTYAQENVNGEGELAAQVKQTGSPL